MKRPTPILALSILLLLTASAQAGPLNTETKSYAVGVGDLEARCDLPTTGQNHGGACFTVPPEARAASVRIADDSGVRLGIGARVAMFVDDFHYYDWWLCEEWEWLGVMPGTTHIRIDIQAVGGISECGPYVPGTQGTITITWHDGQP